MDPELWFGVVMVAVLAWYLWRKDRWKRRMQ